MLNGGHARALPTLRFCTDLSARRPGLEPGPIATDAGCRQNCSSSLCKQLTFVVMGPGSRSLLSLVRDDGGSFVQFSNNPKIVIASPSEAIHRTAEEEWIASSQVLLAMTRRNSAFSPRIAPEVCQKFPSTLQLEGAGNAGRAMRPQPRM